MRLNRKSPGFWEPSVFFWKDRNQWAVEYVVTNEDSGKHRTARKTFVRELRREGKQGTLEEQKQAALTFKNARLDEVRDEKRSTASERKQTKLTRDQLKQAKAAFAIFDQIPYADKSLVDAVNQYRENLKLAVDSPTLAISVQIFLGHKELAMQGGALSQATFRTLKQRLNSFVRFFGSRDRAAVRLGEVRARDIIAYLDEKGGSVRTRKNYRGDLANFFNDAANPKDPHRLLNINPMDEVAVHYGKGSNAKVTRGQGKSRRTPEILQIDEVRQVLRVAIEFKESGVLGFVVAGLFLGMRPSEAVGISKIDTLWETHVKLSEGIAVVSEGIGKIGDRRNITIYDNAKKWLEYLHRGKLPFSYDIETKRGRNGFARFRALAFLGEEDGRRLIRLRRKSPMMRSAEENEFCRASAPKLQLKEDVLRHCFGTNFYYKSGFDQNLTVHEMGNSISTFIVHYRGLLATPESYRDYWSIVPSDFGLL